MWRLLGGLCVQASLLTVAGDTPEHSQHRLGVLQPLVGQWRGVGQPQRGSTRDSWIEEADWIWSFTGATPALAATFTSPRYFRSLNLEAGERDNELLLRAMPAIGNEAMLYTGQRDAQGQIVFLAKHATAERPARLTFRFTAANDRLIVLLEKAGTSAGTYSRLAEVGYTRQGSAFGKAATQRECVVTGGLGNIEVSHAGKTYYVCCTGCRDYFQANPEKVLAEYAARQARP